MFLNDPSLLKGVELGFNEAPKDDAVFEVIDPANLNPIARVADQDASHCTMAVAEVVKAAEELKSMTARTRAGLLYRWFELIKESADDLAQIITSENGKPLAEAQGEVKYASEFLWWFAGEAQRLNGSVCVAHPSVRINHSHKIHQVISSSTAGNRVVTIKQPVGVAGLITPWNFPAAMVTRKIGAALAAGCPSILKPAAETPLTAIALAELARRAGLPAGSFTVVTTLAHTAEVGRVLTQHPEIRKFSFTGSTAVGKLLAVQCTSTMKRVSMELGGNAPFIVFDDADVNFDRAVEGILQSKFRLSGQTCVCANRVYVQAGIHDRLVHALEKRIKAFAVGPGNDPKTTLGPLITPAAVDKVDSHIRHATGNGAIALAGGRRAKQLSGSFCEPTLLVNVPPNSLCTREETFGPLLPIIKFHTEGEVIHMANSVPVGLAAYFFTANISRAWRVAETIEVGMVGVNTGLISDPAVPFGGVKESGQGREGAALGVEKFLETKSITMNIDEGP